MKKKPLTPKQKEAVEFFKNHKKIFGNYPTFEDAGAALGIKPPVVRSRILLAEKKGVVLQRFRIKRKVD